MQMNKKSKETWRKKQNLFREKIGPQIVDSFIKIIIITIIIIIIISWLHSSLTQVFPILCLVLFSESQAGRAENPEKLIV